MASVDFMKLHSAGEVKAMLRHCDKDERLKHEHANADINKQATAQNVQMKRSYDETCALYDEKIAYLDSLEGANKRKDRVTAFSLEIPVPDGLTPDQERAWSNKALKLIADQYGEDNLLNAYLHRDERHAYKDAETGKERMSMSHIHCIYVPEHEGKLNGKWFSSAANMTKLNNAIHKMSMNEFGLPFMTGKGTKSRKSVEQLKNESDIRAVEAEAQAAFIDIIAAGHAEVDEMLREAQEKVDEMLSDAEREASEQAELIRLGKEVRNRQRNAQAQSVSSNVSSRRLPGGYEDYEV